MDKFLFLGFPPAKRKRKKFFEQVLDSRYPVVLYESPHRLLKTLQELKDWKERSSSQLKLVVCRELTKKFETIYRGTIDQVIKKVEQDKVKSQVKGEFVIVLTRI